MKKLFVFCLTIVLLSSCATIVSTKNQTVRFNSYPEGATVYVDNVNVGKTPVDVSVKRKKSHDVLITKSGYKDVNAELKKKFNKYYLGNIPFVGGGIGVVGLIVDPITGAISKFDDSLSVELKALPEEHTKEIPVIEESLSDEFKENLDSVKVEDNGDNVKLILDETAIRFQTNKYNLNERAKTYLSKIGKIIKKRNLVIKVEGHTDSTGTVAYNMSLSEKRAKSVSDYFVSEEGINKKNITIQGKGPKNPVSTNKTAKGRSENRRVEIIIKK